MSRQRTAHGRVMALDVLGGGKHADVRAELKHRLQHRGEEGVVHRETHTMPLRNRRNRRNVAQLERGMPGVSMKINLVCGVMACSTSSARDASTSVCSMPSPVSNCWHTTNCAANKPLREMTTWSPDLSSDRNSVVIAAMPVAKQTVARRAFKRS